MLQIITDLQASVTKLEADVVALEGKIIGRDDLML